MIRPTHSIVASRRMRCLLRYGLPVHARRLIRSPFFGIRFGVGRTVWHFSPDSTSAANCGLNMRTKVEQGGAANGGIASLVVVMPFPPAVAGLDRSTKYDLHGWADHIEPFGTVEAWLPWSAQRPRREGVNRRWFRMSGARLTTNADYRGHSTDYRHSWTIAGHYDAGVHAAPGFCQPKMSNMRWSERLRRSSLELVVPLDFSFRFRVGSAAAHLDGRCQNERGFAGETFPCHVRLAGYLFRVLDDYPAVGAFVFTPRLEGTYQRDAANTSPPHG